MDNFEFTLITDHQRKQILNHVKPKKNDTFSYQNLNLCTCVHNTEKNYYLTLTYYLSDAIKRCDEPDDYSFIVLSHGMAFTVTAISQQFKNKIKITSSFGLLLSKEELTEAINFYLDYRKSGAFEDQYEKEHSGQSIYSLKQEYIKKYVLEADETTQSENTEGENSHKVGRKKNVKPKLQQHGSSRETFYLFICIIMAIFSLIFLVVTLIQSTSSFVGCVECAVVSLVAWIVWKRERRKHK